MFLLPLIVAFYCMLSFPGKRICITNWSRRDQHCSFSCSDFAMRCHLFSFCTKNAIYHALWRSLIFTKKKRLLIACFVQKLSWIYVCFISSSLTDPWLHIAYVSFSYMWSVMRYYMLVYAVSFIYADAFIQGCLFICIIYFCCVDLPLEKWRFLTGICHGTDDLC